MKRIFTLAILVLPFVALAGGGCNNFVTRVSPDGQYLYFSSDRHGGNYEIYRSHLDGWSGLERLTNSSENNFYPSISPDGSKIVFQRGDYGATSEVWIMNSDGTGQVQLTNNSGHDGDPSFSPDGQTIVFDAWDTDTYPEIFTMDLTGGNRTQLTNVAGADWQCVPMYSPNGAHIYFSKGYNADNHIVKMDLNGTNWIDITPPNSFGYIEFNMQFSPDGSKIIFGTSEYTGYNNGSDLVIADTTGANWNVLTASAGGEWWYHAFWHPSNNKLYYTYNPGPFGQWQIYEMSTTGTGSIQLSSCSGVGIQEEPDAKAGISVFPNPSCGYIEVAGTGVVMIEIYDESGRCVVHQAGNRVDVSDLASGYYTVLAKDEENALVGQSKLMKQ